MFSVLRAARGLSQVDLAKCRDPTVYAGAAARPTGRARDAERPSRSEGTRANKAVTDIKRPPAGDDLDSLREPSRLTLLRDIPAEAIRT